MDMGGSTLNGRGDAVGKTWGGLSRTVVALVAMLAGSASAAEPERFEFVRVRMGIPFRITVYAGDEAAANSAADAAYRRIKVFNDVFSDYDPRSETRRLTENIVPGEPRPASDDLFGLLERSIAYSELTGGGFDVTVGPVVKLWRKAKREKVKPTPEEIEAARSVVGYRNVLLDRERRTVAFTKAGVQLDFGGIAAGYACDEAVRIFREHGLPRVMVEASGDFACGDPPPGKEGWTIGIGSLTQPDAEPTRFVRLANRAVTTSGDVYQYVEFDGVRYSHVVDPQTGLGLTTRSSTTVIANDCTAADALAKTGGLLGAERAKTVIGRVEGAEMLMAWADEEGQVREATTAGFGQFVVETP